MLGRIEQLLADPNVLKADNKLAPSTNHQHEFEILPSIKDLTECHGYQTERPQKSKGSTGESVPESCKQPVLQNPAL